MSARPIPPVEALVPHRGPMLLLDSVIDGGAEFAIAEATPRAESWYCDAGGAMPSWCGIELMAQAIAAHIGLLAHWRGGPARPGVLLGTRAYSSKLAAFPAGVVLQIRASLAFRDDRGMGAYDCSIRMGRDLVAEATIKVYEPADFQAFLLEQAV